MKTILKKIKNWVLAIPYKACREIRKENESLRMRRDKLMVEHADLVKINQQLNADLRGKKEEVKKLKEKLKKERAKVRKLRAELKSGEAGEK